MFERIKATLHAYRVEYDLFFNEAALHEGTPSAIERGIERLSERGPPLPLRGRAVAAHDRLRRRQGPRPRALDRPDDVLRRRRRLRRAQARARLRPARAAAGLRPPRLRGADEGEHGGARRRPRPPRDPDPAVRAHRRGRRARLDVQAPRRVHHARRAHRRDRRRRHALLHALALARLDDRPRPRPRAQPVGREPRLLRPVRARADRVGAAQGGGGAGRPRSGRRPGSTSTCTPPSGRWSRSCSPSRRRSPRPPSGARRTGSPPTRSTSRRSSRPSTATAWSSGPSRPGSRTGACACRSSRSGRSRARSTSSGSRRPTRCDRV